MIAEIELRDDREGFERPPWLGVEVTGQPQYYNSSLAEQRYGPSSFACERWLTRRGSSSAPQYFPFRKSTLGRFAMRWRSAAVGDTPTLVITKGAAAPRNQPENPIKSDVFEHFGGSATPSKNHRNRLSWQIPGKSSRGNPLRAPLVALRQIRSRSAQ